jgi:hypothetical protein
MDVDERDEHDGDCNLGPGEYVGHKLCELGSAVDVPGTRGAGGRGDSTECKVYGLDCTLYCIV